VVLGVKLAIEGVLPFVHAEGADPTRVFTDPGAVAWRYTALTYDESFT
jgi:hypothetical protein